MSNHHPMQVHSHTQSFINLLSYGLFYALGYTLLPYFLSHFGAVFGGFLITVLIVIILNIIVITIFNKRQQRRLEKIECSRIALLAMALTLLISLMALYFDAVDIPWLQMTDRNIYQIIGVAGLVAFVINYAIVFYSLWLMQRFWRR